MPKIEVKNLKGAKVEDLQLSEDVFGVKVDTEFLHRVYVIQSANKRTAIAHTKTRAERAGSGKKPWKQKGTGRARVGSVRTPVWKKGGIVFGPRNERNFKGKINKKENKLALKMVLSGKLADKEMVIVDNFSLENKKTKEMSGALAKLGLKGKILMGFLKNEKEALLASRNIANVSNVSVENLNIFDMLNNKFLVLSKHAVKVLEEKYGKRENIKKA
jgi:large subunit ribosomal protein L4